MNYYKVLSVPHNATKKEIRNAYYNLAKKYHPDKNVNAEVDNNNFLLVNTAYSTLVNDNSRRAHDISLQQSSRIFSSELLRDLFNDFTKLSNFIKPTTTFDIITSVKELYKGSLKIINYENVTIKYYPIRSLEIEFENEVLKLNSILVDNLNYFIKDYDLYINIYLNELPISIYENKKYTYQLELPDCSEIEVAIKKKDGGKIICYENKGFLKFPIHEITFEGEKIINKEIKLENKIRGNLYLVIQN